MRFIKYTPIPNFGARVFPLPFATKWLIETEDWHTVTWTLRRFTHKQFIALSGRCRRYGVEANGPAIPYTIMPVITVLDHMDLYDFESLAA